VQEFDVIKKYLTFKSYDKNIILNTGDDAAVLTIPAKTQLVTSSDTFLENTHFLQGTPPADIAYKSFMVNLSDMAAMGAVPQWTMLNLTLPAKDDKWLCEFSNQLKEILTNYKISLIGGDTTQGPLSITITIYGFIKDNQFLTRAGAKTDDSIYISNSTGEAALGLLMLQDKYPKNDYFVQKLQRPQAQNKLGLLLKDYANSCIDISDGLICDLNHILLSSNKGAELNLKNLITTSSLNDYCSEDQTKNLILYGGDDYELLWTLSKEKEKKFLKKIKETTVSVQKIGIITDNIGIKENNKKIKIKGWSHF
jgi:thiamine-monophosphate kinase